jgi:hypothetical protein
VPEPGPVGPSVEPLGDGLMKLLPEGFWVLFAPAAALPALLPRPLLVALPVVPIDEPVVVPPVVDDPGAVPVAPGLLVPAAPGLLADPAPACASANVLVSAITAAKPIVASLMIISLHLLATKGQTTLAADVPELMRS